MKYVGSKHSLFIQYFLQWLQVTLYARHGVTRHCAKQILAHILYKWQKRTQGTATWLLCKEWKDSRRTLRPRTLQIFIRKHWFLEVKNQVPLLSFDQPFMRGRCPHLTHNTRAPQILTPAAGLSEYLGMWSGRGIKFAFQKVGISQ